MLHQRTALTGEMEGHGFAAFCDEELKKTWLMWRGITDHGEERRVKDLQFTATLAAATAARLMLETHLDLRRPTTTMTASEAGACHAPTGGRRGSRFS